MPVTLYTPDNGVAEAALSSQFAKIVRQTYEKPFLKALDQDTFVFQLFPRKSVSDAYVRWKIKHTGNSGVEWYDEDDTYGAAGQQSYENAELPIKMVRINVQFSNLAEAASKGTGSWVDVRADEVESALDDLRDAINDRILETAFGADFRKIETLGSIIAASGTHATINRATSTWWQSFVLANAGTARPLTVALMQQTHAELQKPRRKAKTSHILTSPALVDTYSDLADARRRFTDSKVDLGYDAPTYKGIPLLGVQSFPENSAGNSRMYWIDKRPFNIQMLRAFETDEVSVSTDVTKIAIKSYLQLTCKAPFQQALITDLTNNF